MNILEQIEEQITNYVDPTYSEELSIIEKRLADAWEIYDYEHLAHNVPPGSELYHMGKFIDFAIEDFQYALMNLEKDPLMIDWPEDPLELDEEMTQQEEFYLNIL
jgi:hypothetical protein